MEINREEIIWAAGFFDGEGNVRVSNYIKDGREYTSLVLQITQVDKQVLERFKKATGDLGNVTGPYRADYTVKGQPSHRFRIQTFEKTQAAIGMIYQFLSPIKQDQISRALKQYNNWYQNSNHIKGHRPRSNKTKG